MKKLSTSFLLAPLFLLTACVMTKTYTKEEKKWASKDKKVTIVTTHGDQIVGNKLTTGNDKIDKDNYINYKLLDGRKFTNDEIASIQDKYGYFGKFGSGTNIMWVKQLKRGKIN